MAVAIEIPLDPYVVGITRKENARKELVKKCKTIGWTVGIVSAIVSIVCFMWWFGNLLNRKKFWFFGKAGFADGFCCWLFRHISCFTSYWSSVGYIYVYFLPRLSRCCLVF